MSVSALFLWSGPHTVGWRAQYPPCPQITAVVATHWLVTCRAVRSRSVINAKRQGTMPVRVRLPTSALLQPRPLVIIVALRATGLRCALSKNPSMAPSRRQSQPMTLPDRPRRSVCVLIGLGGHFCCAAVVVVVLPCFFFSAAVVSVSACHICSVRFLPCIRPNLCLPQQFLSHLWVHDLSPPLLRHATRSRL
jgi:hypothetical protein